MYNTLSSAYEQKLSSTEAKITFLYKNNAFCPNNTPARETFKHHSSFISTPSPIFSHTRICSPSSLSLYISLSLCLAPHHLLSRTCASHSHFVKHSAGRGVIMRSRRARPCANEPIAGEATLATLSSLLSLSLSPDTLHVSLYLSLSLSLEPGGTRAPEVTRTAAAQKGCPL